MIFAIGLLLIACCLEGIVVGIFFLYVEYVTKDVPDESILVPRK